MGMIKQCLAVNGILIPSKEVYDGSKEDFPSGVWTDSGAAPAKFFALGILVVNAYKRMGHGAKLTCKTSRPAYS